jgi:hypothetical protein
MPNGEPILAAPELVMDERGDEIDGRELLGLRLAESGVEDGGHGRQSASARRVIRSRPQGTGSRAATRAPYLTDHATPKQVPSTTKPQAASTGVR